MPSLALLTSHSTIVLALNATLGCQGLFLSGTMPTNYTVSIQMKIEPFLLSQLEGGPQCKSLRRGPSL